MNTLFLRIVTSDGLEGWGEGFGHATCQATRAVIFDLGGQFALPDFGKVSFIISATRLGLGDGLWAEATEEPVHKRTGKAAQVRRRRFIGNLPLKPNV
jgi:L-alanine-DL-glutamate epimerase-like enolase superfamily enzyme